MLFPDCSLWYQINLSLCRCPITRFLRPHGSTTLMMTAWPLFLTLNVRPAASTTICEKMMHVFKRSKKKKQNNSEHKTKCIKKKHTVLNCNRKLYDVFQTRLWKQRCQDKFNCLRIRRSKATLNSAGFLKRGLREVWRGYLGLLSVRIKAVAV